MKSSTKSRIASMLEWGQAVGGAGVGLGFVAVIVGGVVPGLNVVGYVGLVGALVTGGIAIGSGYLKDTLVPHEKREFLVTKNTEGLTKEEVKKYKKAKQMKRTNKYANPKHDPIKSNAQVTRGNGAQTCIKNKGIR